MTANKFNVGDAVRRKNDPNTKYIVSKVTDKGICVYIPNFSPSPEYGMNACDIEPYDNTLHCRYCGVEIVIDSKSTIAPYRDETAHKLPCPLANLESGYNTYQEAIEAYSMKGEG